MKISSLNLVQTDTELYCKSSTRSILIVLKNGEIWRPEQSSFPKSAVYYTFILFLFYCLNYVSNNVSSNLDTDIVHGQINRSVERKHDLSSCSLSSV